MSNQNNGGEHDLEFSTTVDGSVRQTVPLPPPSGTNNVLSNMINGGTSNASTTRSASMSAPSPPPSSYAPSSPLPAYLQFNRSAHPTACLFHILFKGLALLLYAFGSHAIEDVLVTVLCIILLAADFWVVKNVTGRLLVGLRWWNRLDPISGKTSWIFESAAPAAPDLPPAAGNAFDSKFFWGILYLAPVLWGCYSVAALLQLHFHGLVTLACALALSASNVYGYYKCSSDQREKWHALMDRGAMMGMSAMVRGGMIERLGSWIGGRGGGGAQPVPQQDPNTMPGTFA